jgi:general secretion pathway protein D
MLRFLVFALLAAFALSVAIMESTFAQEEGPPSKQPPAESPVNPPAQPEQPVKPPVEQPKDQPGAPIKPGKMNPYDRDKEALFVITAGEELTVGQLLEQIKKMTGKEVIPVPGITERRIKFVSTFRANYTILEKILNVNGITLEHAVERGNEIIYAQTDQQLVRKHYGRTSKVLGKGEEMPPENEIVTAILEVQYADPTQIERTLTNRIIDKQGPGSVISVQNQPVLIVRDFAPEVEYYQKLIKAIDVMPKGVQLFIIRLEHAVASDIANYLSQLGGQQRRFSRPGMAAAGTPADTGFEAQFVADTRTNKLIILTFEENYPQIEKVVSELDEEIPRGTGDIHVYQLKHVDCTKLATALSSVITGQQQRQVGVRGAGGQVPEQLQVVPSRVVAEPQTNSLIIEAEQRNYEELVGLIEQLDVRRPQVLIEAAIIEVTADSTTNLGIELATVDLAGTGFRGAGGSLFGLSTVDVTDLTKTPTGGLGLTALLYRDSLDRIPVLLQTLRTNGDVNVLSSPRILTNDNEKGELKVTEQVATTTYIYSSVQQATSQQTFGGYQEAGITLTITPHISTDNYLRLEIDLKVEAFSASPVAGSIAPPPKTSRQVTGMVTVPDREIVVIGGLTNERETETVNKVPLLGDIPILGVLFRSSSTMKVKTNLYVFLTPHIITEEKFDSLKKISLQQREEARVHGGRVQRLSQILEDISTYQARSEMRAYREMVDSLKAIFGRDFETVYVLEGSDGQRVKTNDKK